VNKLVEKTWAGTVVKTRTKTKFDKENSRSRDKDDQMCLREQYKRIYNSMA